MKKNSINTMNSRFWDFFKKNNRAILIGFILIGSAFLCISFTSKNNSENSTFDKIISNDTIKGNQPKIDIKVNKEYDENGNIIRYDSSYSSSYFYSNSDLTEKEMDSIMNSFKPFFFDNYSNILDHSFDRFFFNDSLFFNDFYRDDFFEREYQRDYFPLNDVMRQFDSLKNEFFRRSIPFSPDETMEEKGTKL